MSFSPKRPARPLVTPAGEQSIALETIAHRQAMSIDWIMTFADGMIARAHLRVTVNGPEASIYAFVLEAPPAPLELLEGAPAAQKVTLAHELTQLKQLLEST